MFLKGVVVGEKTTKDGFNKYLGYTAKDLPTGEDKKAEGYIFEVEGKPNHEEHEGSLIWIPASGVTELPEEVVKVAQHPSVYASLSPLKQAKLVKLVKELI